VEYSRWLAIGIYYLSIDGVRHILRRILDIPEENDNESRRQDEHGRVDVTWQTGRVLSEKNEK